MRIPGDALSISRASVAVRSASSSLSSRSSARLSHRRAADDPGCSWSRLLSVDSAPWNSPRSYWALARSRRDPDSWAAGDAASWAAAGGSQVRCSSRTSNAGSMLRFDMLRRPSARGCKRGCNRGHKRKSYSVSDLNSATRSLVTTKTFCRVAVCPECRSVTRTVIS